MDYISNLSDTITALATPEGVSALAIIRVSGANCFTLFEPFIPQFRFQNKAFPHLKYLTLINPANQKVLDQAIVSFYKNPHSFTGEDSIEISCHGSPLIIESILQALQDQGIRLAIPGEFSFRAYWNGKIDLIQAEAIHCMIHSHSEKIKQWAQDQSQGKLSQYLKEYQNTLMSVLAAVNVQLDYGDQPVSDLTSQWQSLVHQLDPLLDSFQATQIYQKGLNILLAGPPNAGKSSLFNYLLKEDRSIVSSVAGTTRDLMREHLFWEGIPIRLYDSAGLRKTEELVERKGIEKTYQTADQADFIFFLIEYDSFIEKTLKDYQEFFQKYSQKVLIVITKIDLMPENAPALFSHWQNLPVTCISLQAPQGIAALWTFLKKQILLEPVKMQADTQASLVIYTQRQEQSLKQLQQYIQQAYQLWQENQAWDILADQLQQALEILGQLTGQVSNEDVLSVMFSQFCLGK